MKMQSVLNSTTRSLLASFLCVAICMPAIAAEPAEPGPDPQLGLGKKKKDDDTLAAERDEKERKRDAKNLGRYDKLKEYSTTKYKGDPDFKDDVDERFEELLRDHAELAYKKNTTMTSYMKTVNEDNWRMHVGLYDNLLVQNMVNRIGQKVVPESSEKLFAFKVLPDPVPMAETLATGTIYISTGMISLLDSEAQLAYVLAHEMAHVNYDHWRERAMMAVGTGAYAADQQAKAAKIGAVVGIAGAVTGGILGGRNGGAGTAILGALGGGALGFGVGEFLGQVLNRPLIVNWDKIQEDQADDLALKQVLNTNFDVREVPKLYLALEKNVTRDARVGLGFLGDRKRITQRRNNVQALLEGAMKADIETKLKAGALVGDRAEFRNLMAELKRDNGIMAYYHDMFELSRNNLRDALAVRDNDPAVHYFYGKVMTLTGRNPSELKEASDSFVKAAALDYRNQNYGSSIHAAISMMGEQRQQGNEKQIVNSLDNYVTNYAKWVLEANQMRLFPPNLDSVYEYMRLYGDKGWRPKAPDLRDVRLYTQYQGLLGPEPMSPNEPTNVSRIAAPNVTDQANAKMRNAAAALPGAGTAQKIVNGIKPPGK